MPEVDSLDVKIAASAENAIKSLDTLITKLNTVTGALKFDTSGIKNISASIGNVSKSVETAMSGVDKSVEQSMQKAEKSASNSAKKIVLTLDDARKKVTESWKSTDLVGRSRTSLEKMQIDLQSQLTNRMRSKEAKDIAGTASGKTYNENLVIIAQLEKQIEEVGNRLKELEMPTQTAEELGKVIKLLNQTGDSVSKSSEETQQFGKDLDYVRIEAEKAQQKTTAEFENIAKASEEAQSKVQDMFANIRPLGFSGNAFELEKFVANLENDIAKIESKMQNLSALGVGEDTQRFQGLNYDLQQAISSLEKWEAELSKLRDAGELDISIPSLEESIDNATMKWGIFSKTLRAFRLVEPSEQLQNIRTRLDEIQQKYNQIADNIEQRAQSQPFFGTTQQFKNQQTELEALRQEYQDLINTQRQLSLSGYQFDFGRWTEGFRNVGGAVLNATGKIGSFVKRLASVAINAKTARKSMDNLKNVSNQLTKSLTRVTNMLKMMIVRMALRKVIEGVGTGFKGLALYSDEFNRSLSMLINSLKQLGYSVSAAVSPLVNAFAPALNQIIQLAIKAVNYINQLLSALTGKGTWIRAKEQADNYADSINKAGKAAKGSLRAFDELKVINTNNGSGRSGTEEINPGDMFETVDIESDIMDLSERIKAMWEKADFTELGNIIGQKIKYGLDSIDWNPIQETAGRIGKSIATLINGFVETEGLGTSIGQTIGNAVNTGIVFANNFLDNTNFDSIGTFIGEGINGATKTIDFEGIGHFLAQSLNGVFDTLGNMSVTVDWKNLGANLSSSVNTSFEDFKWDENAQSLSNFAKGLLDITITFLEETDWQELGNNVAEFIKNIDWNGLADRLFEGIGAVIGGLASFMWGLIEDAWNDVVDWWYDTAYEDGEFTMKGLLEGIWNKIKDIGTWIKEHIFQPFIDGFKKAFDIHSPSKVMEEQGNFVMDGLFNGITSMIEKVTKPFRDFAANIKSVFEKLKQNVQSAWSTVSGWFREKVITPLVNFFSPIVAKISGFFTNIWTKVKSTWTSASSWFNTKVIIPIRSAFNLATTAIAGFFTKLWAGVKAGVVTAMNGVISGIEGAVNFIIRGVNSLIEKVNKVVSAAGEILGQDWKGIGTLNEVTLNRIKVSTYAQGGFPEDGWFRASKGEYFGQFDDGTSYIANNKQVSDAMAQTLYPAVYNAVSAALQNNKDLLGSGDTKVYVGTREITDVVIDNIADRTIRNQKTPFPIMV